MLPQMASRGQKRESSQSCSWAPDGAASFWLMLQRCAKHSHSVNRSSLCKGGNQAALLENTPSCRQNDQYHEDICWRVASGSAAEKVGVGAEMALDLLVMEVKKAHHWLLLKSSVHNAEPSVLTPAHVHTAHRTQNLLYSHLLACTHPTGLSTYCTQPACLHTARLTLSQSFKQSCLTTSCSWLLDERPLSVCVQPSASHKRLHPVKLLLIPLLEITLHSAHGE